MIFIIKDIFLVLDHLLIVVEGTKTPEGEARKARPHRHVVPRRLGGRPQESEVPGTEINK
jgi:hypothetical protein